MANIELTQEQWADLYKYRDEMALYGYSNQPADREASEKVFHFFYKKLGKTLNKIIWYDSPKEPFFRSGREITWMWGQHEIYWIAFYRWVEKQGLATYNKEDSEILRNWEILSKSCGWWWPREDEVWACERPYIQRVDERGLLHCEDGPAIAYKDSFEIFAWHGMRIPKEWILDKENVDPGLALTWENIEQRRALAEIIGWDKVLKKLKVKKIHKDWSGELLEAKLPDSNIPTRFVRVLCPTGEEERKKGNKEARIFAIPVPSTVKTALEAVASTYNLTPEEYAKLEVRT